MIFYKQEVFEFVCVLMGEGGGGAYKMYTTIHSTLKIFRIPFVLKFMNLK
jgi:hypothetical protein